MKEKFIKTWVLGLLLQAGGAEHSWADRSIAFDASRLKPETTEFELVVVGSSDLAPHMVAGHLVLRARAPSVDYSFDWGIFDPTQEDFFIDYVFGHLDYQHVVRPFRQTVMIYRREGRALVAYPLRFNREQKAAVIAELVRWALPENRVYRYDIVFNNCSTVIGGLIASQLDSQAQERLQSDSGTTVRKTGLPHLAHYPWIEVFADLVGGRRADQPIARQQFFYLPIRVPGVLAEAAPDLFAPERTILRGKDDPPSSIHWTPRVGWILTAFWALLVVCIRFGWLGHRSMVGAVSLFGFVNGIVGMILVFMSFVSAHSFAWSNANLFFFWPIDVLAPVLFWKSPKAFLVYGLGHLTIGGLVAAMALLVTSLNVEAGFWLSIPTWGGLTAIGWLYGQKGR